MRIACQNALLAAAALLIAACAPEVGTEKWCERMDGKPTGDWTANNARDYAKYCVLKNYKDADDDG